MTRLASALHGGAGVRFDATVPIPEKLPADAHIGAYRIVTHLARGGTATVFLAEHAVTRRRVAIKMLDPFYRHHDEIVERLFCEYTISECTRHPGVVAIHQAGWSDLGIPYLVMEYLDGETLHFLETRSRLALRAIIEISAQVAEALAALHAQGFIHCDVKPDNVCVLCEPNDDGAPQVKVFDLGVARRVDAAPTEAIAGTPAFMAPEQWRGRPTPKSDVYALGCMMYELVTGEPVFSGTLPQMMTAHCERLPERPSIHRSDIPADLERLIVRALAKDPALRPTMAELEAELRKLGAISASPALDATG